MAYYSNGAYLTQESGAEYNAVHHAGAAAPSSGIYRCEACGLSCTSVMSRPLPSQNHHEHKPGSGPISWRLIVKSHWR
jgi:hypothetical protein